MSEAGTAPLAAAAPDPAASGWQRRETFSGFPQLVGPIWTRADPDGTRAYAFVAERRHLNMVGVVHGGMVSTLADLCLGIEAWHAAGGAKAVTMQLNVHFVGAVREGDLAEARAQVLRAARSVVFLRGLVTVGGRTVASADGVWKVLGAP